RAAFTVGYIQGDSVAAVSALEKALKDTEVRVRLNAVGSLAGLGPKAIGTLPALIEVLRDTDQVLSKSPYLRLYTVSALSQLGAAAVPALLAALPGKDKDPGVRLAAVVALGQIGAGAEAETAAPALMTILKEKRCDIRTFAAWTLGSIGPKAKPAVPVLIEIARDKDPPTRLAAIRALGALGPVAKAAGPALTDILNEPTCEIHFPAAVTLSQIGYEAKAGVPALIKMLQGPCPWLQALEALGRIGPEARAAVPAILPLLKNPD